MGSVRIFLHSFFLISFLINGLGPISLHAEEPVLPAPGTMVGLSPNFRPPVLKGISVHPDNPLRLEFILDEGDDRVSLDRPDGVKAASLKLIKYFLTSMTIPDKNMWVNLSPYEKDRIAPPVFGRTEMGRDLLAQDYLLKQLTASLIYPNDEFGQKFWKRVYQEASRRFGTNFIQISTFNKVWIVPEKAVIYENPDSSAAYVVEAKLKVLLEEDYLSWSKHAEGNMAAGKQGTAGAAQHLGMQIIKEIVLPQLSEEINEGKSFAPLRQIYNSLILAAWYKRKIKTSILSRGYADQSRVAGMQTRDPEEKQKIYEQYLEAFKLGAYNIIKEEMDPVSKQMVPRKYFSGGAAFGGIDSALTSTTQVPVSNAGLRAVVTDLAMIEGAPGKPEGDPSTDKAMLEQSVENRLFYAGSGQRILMDFSYAEQKRDIVKHLTHLGLREEKIVMWQNLRFTLQQIKDRVFGIFFPSYLASPVDPDHENAPRFVVVTPANWDTLSHPQWLAEHPQVRVLVAPRDMVFDKDPLIQRRELAHLARIIGVNQGGHKNVDDLSRTHGELLKIYNDGVDPLTGLLTRAAGEKVFRMKLADVDSRRAKYNGAAMLLDVDAFKTINDTFGHSVGDAVLASFGKVTRNHVRRGDIVRLGGEEIMIVLFLDHDTSPDDVQQKTDMLKRVHRAIPLEVVPGKEETEWNILRDPQRMIETVMARLKESTDKETILKGLRHQIGLQNNMSAAEVASQLSTVEDFMKVLADNLYAAKQGDKYQRQTPFILDRWIITASAGVVFFDFEVPMLPEGWDVEFWKKLNEAADRNLYKAKLSRNDMQISKEDPRSLGMPNPEEGTLLSSLIASRQKVSADGAMTGSAPDYGGIDLNPSQVEMNLKNEGSGTPWKIDADLLLKMQKARGLQPVIIDIHPVADLPLFLGVKPLPAKGKALHVEAAGHPPTAG